MPIIDITIGEKASKGKWLYHYVEYGSGEPLLLFHGFTGSTENWQRQIDIFAQRYHVFAIDLPGHGQTKVINDATLHSIPFVIKDIANFYWHFQLEQTHLLGYSMGGRFTLSFAVSYPKLVKSLILESASPGLQPGKECEARRKADDELADKIEANGIEWFVDYWEKLSLWNSQTPEQKAYLRQQRLKNDSVGLANSLRGMGTGVMPSLWDELTHLQMPVKLIVGELDRKYVEINREMAELIPNVDLSIVAGAGHTVHLEKPDEYAELVLQFLEKHS